MTDHPAKGCAKHQIEVFEFVVDSIPRTDDLQFLHWIPREFSDHYTETFKILENKGLVTSSPTPKLYRVPLHIQRQWCQWAAEQPDIEI